MARTVAHRLQSDKHSRMCSRCAKLKPEADFTAQGARCRECRKQVELNRGRGDIAQGMRQLIKLNQATQMPQIQRCVEALSENLNPELWSEILIEELHKVRTGEGLPEDARWAYRPGEVRQYLKMLMELMQIADDQTQAQANFGSLSDEELTAGLAEVAMQALEQNQDFRERVVLQLLHNDQGLLRSVVVDAIQQYPELLDAAFQQTGEVPLLTEATEV